MGMQLGAARLLYGMGRGGAIPRSFFGALEPRRRIPRNNVLFVGAVALAGALALPAIAGEATGFDLGASLLNFGALISFMGYAIGHNVGLNTLTGGAVRYRAYSPLGLTAKQIGTVIAFGTLTFVLGAAFVVFAVIGFPAFGAPATTSTAWHTAASSKPSTAKLSYDETNQGMRKGAATGSAHADCPGGNPPSGVTEVLP